MLFKFGVSNVVFFCGFFEIFPKYRERIGYRKSVASAQIDRIQAFFLEVWNQNKCQ
jgi:hypothetical protein